MSPVDTFLSAKDRHGKPLFPGAHIVAEHGALSLVDWQDNGNAALRHRTLIDNVSGCMLPGIYGTAQHVQPWLVRQVNREATLAVNIRGIQ